MCIIILGQIIEAVSSKDILDLIIEREVKLRMEQVVSNIFVEQINIARKCFADHIEHRALVE